MKLPFTLCLCLLCAAGAWGRLAVQGDAPPAATVLKHGRAVEMKWVARGWEEYDPDSTRPSDARHLPVMVYTAKIRNEATKRIAGVVWDYVFTRESDGEELARAHLRSRTKIDAGKSATVRAYALRPPHGSRTVSVEELKRGEDRRFRDDVEIECLFYEDGTWWRRAGVSQEVCEGKKGR